MVKSGQAVTVPVTTSDPLTGVSRDADALPSAVLVVDGADDAAVCTVSDTGTGRYKVAVTLPALTAGQVVALVVSATVHGIAGSAVVWEDVADTARVSEVAAKTANLPSDPADQSAVEAAITAATNPLATAAALAALHDFDPAADAVAHVTLVDTTTAVTEDIAAEVDLSGVLAAIAALPDDADVAALDALLDAIKAKTDALGSLAVTVTSPVASSGTITLQQGDDYAAADGRAVTVTVADEGHVLGLDAATVRLKATQAAWTGSAASTADGWTVTFELTHEETAALTVSRQSYELEATLASGHVVTLATGTLVLVQDIPAVL